MPVPHPRLSLLAPLAATVGEHVLLAVLPHGGQRRSRRNAWAAMATDAGRARARREATAAMDRLTAAAGERRGSAGRTAHR